MSPAAMLNELDYGDVAVPLLNMATAEIERMRAEKSKQYHRFPSACVHLLRRIDGNHRCVDCGEHDPQWAAVSYGALLCLQCSGHHRSLGVQVSCVRSIDMDEWSLEQVLGMLEGGNGQLTGFFSRHALTEDSCPETNKKITRENVTRLRYRTKAALFYRQQMNLHVAKVLEGGPYRGKSLSRRVRLPKPDHRNSTVE